MTGRWRKARRCAECGDGIATVPRRDDDDQSEEELVAWWAQRICPTCGAMGRMVGDIGRKLHLFEWWNPFTWLSPSHRWEWRSERKKQGAVGVSVPLVVTGKMRARMVALGFTDAMVDTMTPAEAWAVLREADAEWFKEQA